MFMYSRANTRHVWLNMSRFLFIQAILLVIAPALANQQDYPFKLVYRDEPGGQILMAQNNGPAPILATVSLLDPINATVDHPFPIVTVVRPKETRLIASVHSVVAGQRYRISISYKFSIGDPDTIHDPAATYRLPFQGGQAITIGQVAGGKITTHTDPGSRFAIDFVVPVGTPILAARKGRVVDIDQGYIEGGKDSSLKANHILILHEDGTLGVYSHLSPNRITVTFGQWVDAGTLIGYSGNTGYSTGPHLHFAVLVNARTPDGTAKYISVPMIFVNEASSHALRLIQDESLVVNNNGHLLSQESTTHAKLKAGVPQRVLVPANP